MLRKKKKKIIQHHERLTSSKLNETCSGNVTIVPAEDDEVEGLSKICASPSHYSSARESIQSADYVQVPDRSLSPETTACQVTLISGIIMMSHY